MPYIRRERYKLRKYSSPLKIKKCIPNFNGKLFSICVVMNALYIVFFFFLLSCPLRGCAHNSISGMCLCVCCKSIVENSMNFQSYYVVFGL